MKPYIATSATLAVVMLAPSAQAEQKFQKLTAAQIQATFVGTELTDESHWGEVFGRSTLAITWMGHNSAGTWRIRKDQLCLDTGEAPCVGCYEVWISGKNVELRNQDSTLPLEGVLQKPTDAR